MYFKDLFAVGGRRLDDDSDVKRLMDYAVEEQDIVAEGAGLDRRRDSRQIRVNEA